MTENEDFLLATDSTVDLDEAFLEENGIKIMKLGYRFGGEEYGNLTGMELDMPTFYKRLEEGELPETSQVTLGQAEEQFEEFLKINRNILYLAFSSGLSGTFQSVAYGATVMNERYPDCKIKVIDTLSASSGEGLLLHYAIKYRNEGKSLDEVAGLIQNMVPNMVHIVAADDLFHLHRGGRVSKTSAVLGTLVQIKPIIHMNDEGKLIVVDKVRGRKRSLTTLVDYMDSHMGSFRDKQEVVYISHANCRAEAEETAELVKSRFGIEDIRINWIGGTIGSHTGPGTVALFFLGESR